MDADDWKLEMNRMLVSFANQAVFSLGKINRRFRTLGRPFDEKFRQYFLKMSHQRLDMSYDTVLFANETENRTNIAPSFEDNAQLVKSEEKVSAIEFKAEKLDDGTLIEIYDSDDGEYSGMRAAIDLTSDKTEIIKSNVPLVQTIPNQNDDIADFNSESEVKLKDEPNTTNEDESFDIPLVEFDPNIESGTIGIVSTNNQSGECSKTQQSIAFLNTDINTSNGIGGKRFKCLHCNSSFKFKSYLKRHQPIHANEKLLGVKDRHEIQCEGRHFECHLCKVFVTKNKCHMQNHMRTHTGARPFRCRKCNKSFQLKHSLRFHLNSKLHSRIRP